MKWGDLKDILNALTEADLDKKITWVGTAYGNPSFIRVKQKCAIRDHNGGIAFVDCLEHLYLCGPVARPDDLT